MRAAMAQRRFNPAGGRLSSLSMLRILWETSWAALQPLVLQHEAVPWAGGTVVPPNPPGSLSLELSPSRDLSAAPTRLHWGGGCLPVGAGVAQGWQVVCVGDEGSKRLLSRTHTLFWEELDACWAGKYCQRALWGGEGSTGVASSSVVCVVCVGGRVCCLLARCKSCLWLQRCFVWIYRAMLVAGSPAPSPWTVFKVFPLQLRPASSCHWCSVCPHQPGSAPRSTRPCGKQEALAPGKLFKPNSKQ